jgi:hypothetical protein
MSLLPPGLVYTLCLLTSVACAILLVRAYLRSGSKLLLWSAVAFSLLALNNLFVVVDMLMLREIDLTWARQATSLAAVVVLIYAFIWELD